MKIKELWEDVKFWGNIVFEVLSMLCIVLLLVFGLISLISGEYLKAIATYCLLMTITLMDIKWSVKK